MSDFPAILPDKLSYNDRDIRFLRFQEIRSSGYIAALVVIEPSTTGIVPDIVVGFGRTEIDSKADAFNTAKQQIAKSSKR